MDLSIELRKCTEWLDCLDVHDSVVERCISDTNLTMSFVLILPANVAAKGASLSKILFFMIINERMNKSYTWC